VKPIERFTSPDGTVIACHTAGHGPPLVLLHGTSADHTRWVRVIDALSAKFAMYVLDHRGRRVPMSRLDYPSPKTHLRVRAVQRVM
jgi:alpha-beta hydrolase superfamily lysophospholipase